MSPPVSIPYVLNEPPAVGDIAITAPSSTVSIAAAAKVSGTVAITAPVATAEISGSVNAAGLLTVMAPMPTVELYDAGQPHAFATYTIEVDWNNDGDWLDGNEDVTEDINALSGVAIQYGRDAAQPFGPTAAGTAGMVLDNFAEKYNPANQASPLYGLLIPGRPVRMRATVGASTFSLFTGHTDDSPIDPDIKAQTVDLSMLDNLARLRSQEVTTGLFQGLRTGEALGKILDAVGWPAGLRDIDKGATVMPWWWVSEVNAYEAALDLVGAEGPPALLSVGADGEIVFRDRHHRLARSSSRDVQAYFTAADFAEGTRVNLSWADVINHVEFDVEERTASPLAVEVWRTEDILTLTDGETVTIKAQPSDPFLGAVTPELGIDYVMMQGTVTISLASTNGQVANINITASGGPAVVYGMALRAFPLAVTRTRVVELQDNASVAIYGRRSWPGRAPFTNIHDAAAQAAIIIATRANPLAKLTGRMVSVNGTETGVQIVRDLSDRIEASGDPLLAGQWFIDSISHRFDGRVGHETTFTCEAVPRQIGSVFIVGSSSDGVVGTNKLGRMALDEPRDVFMIGSATNGVLASNLLAY